MGGSRSLVSTGVRSVGLLRVGSSSRAAESGTGAASVIGASRSARTIRAPVGVGDARCLGQPAQARVRRQPASTSARAPRRRAEPSTAPAAASDSVPGDARSRAGGATTCLLASGGACSRPRRVSNTCGGSPPNAPERNAVPGGHQHRSRPIGEQREPYADAPPPGAARSRAGRPAGAATAAAGRAQVRLVRDHLVVERDARRRRRPTSRAASRRGRRRRARASPRSAAFGRSRRPASRRGTRESPRSGAAGRRAPPGCRAAAGRRGCRTGSCHAPPSVSRRTRAAVGMQRIVRRRGSPRRRAGW